jgi:hypothetical protein
MVYSSMVHVAGGEGGSTRHDDKCQAQAAEDGQQRLPAKLFGAKE